MVVTTALDTDTTINALPNLSQKKFDYSERQIYINVPTGCSLLVATLINKYVLLSFWGVGTTL